MDSQAIMRAYLLSLFADYTEGYIYLYLPEENRVYWYGVNDIEQMIEDAQGFKDKTVFVSVHPSSVSKTSRKRALRDDISSLANVFLDFDIANSDAHAQTSLPKSQSELDLFLYDIGLKDRISLYHSGNGWHGYASLQNPIEILTEENRIQAERISKGLNNYIKSEATRLRGWKFDNVGSIEHVARLVGSYNHKTGEPKLVHPISLSDYKFSSEELEALAPAPVQIPVTSDPLAGWIKQAERPDRKPVFETIMVACEFVRHCVVDAANLPEPLWKELISITARCENAEEVSHRASKPHPKYSRAETDAKVETSLKTVTGVVTCKHIREEIGFSGCKTCPLAASKMKSPIALGYIDEYLAGLFRRFVYDLKTKRFYEINPQRRAS
ncbi:hypothetical protein [Litorimonas sp. WD9-15]|uniref:hypothetical protein n=1 Tax=Litorimonas sp. WD9-15 TaxID=3418716 RepID=UPI003D061701